ncbi:hypothetical protein EON73_02880 [bacterium]|nr:MAG: hypothetical protein EON73_02880 [bacterium]
MTYTIRIPDDENIVIPIHFEPQENIITLPARSESFRIFHFSNFKENSVIFKQEIANGIFIPTTVIKSSYQVK